MVCLICAVFSICVECRSFMLSKGILRDLIPMFRYRISILSSSGMQLSAVLILSFGVIIASGFPGI